MTRPPKSKKPAAGPVDAMGQTLERALDPLTSVLKRAGLARAEKSAAAASPVKSTLPVSPLAVPFPDISVISGVEMATGTAGFYKHERPDLLVMKFAKGTNAAGVFTRHGVGSAPVDWCKKNLAATSGADVRALVVNAGCANSFTGKPGADAVRRYASAIAKRFDCRQRDVMVASTGVIGVLLDDSKIVQRLPEVEAALHEDGWAQAAAAIMTTDTFPKGAYAEALIDGQKVKIAGICKGSGMIAPDMATMLAFVATDAAIAPAALQTLVSLYTRTTFNCVTVDGDRSTNDTLLLFATGQSGAPKISRAGDRRLADFREKLEAVLLDLAQQLVRDGEGAFARRAANCRGSAAGPLATTIAAGTGRTGTLFAQGWRQIRAAFRLALAATAIASAPIIGAPAAIAAPFATFTLISWRFSWHVCGHDGETAIAASVFGGNGLASDLLDVAQQVTLFFAAEGDS